MMSYRDKLSIENSKALVTGAGRGIGAACAEALAEMGAKVFCTDFSFEAAKRQRLTFGSWDIRLKRLNLM
ncbi:hypothetical protein VINI7043_00617 [Vibrio nigripulchritudo ATCC 27043]|nr:hypothetical protein VINI7043_00617 [Vibrio nigripulchritudo ATCC 27043]